MNARMLKYLAFAAFTLMGGVQVASAHGPQTVEISKLVFSPAEITMHAGDTIIWVNKDSIAHTATGTMGGPWEVMLPPGKTVESQLTTPGTVEYHCRFHPNMKGRITVLSK